MCFSSHWQLNNYVVKQLSNLMAFHCICTISQRTSMFPIFTVEKKKLQCDSCHVKMWLDKHKPLKWYSFKDEVTKLSFQKKLITYFYLVFVKFGKAIGLKRRELAHDWIVLETAIFLYQYTLNCISEHRHYRLMHCATRTLVAIWELKLITHSSKAV